MKTKTIKVGIMSIVQYKKYEPKIWFKSIKSMVQILI
jgi:predicted transcriptional regulator